MQCRRDSLSAVYIVKMLFMLKFYMIKHLNILMTLTFILNIISGLSMSLVKSENGVHYFTYEHSVNYQQVQLKFLEAVESLNPDNIVVSFGVIGINYHLCITKTVYRNLEISSWIFVHDVSIT